MRLRCRHNGIGAKFEIRIVSTAMAMDIASIRSTIHSAHLNDVEPLNRDSSETGDAELLATVQTTPSSPSRSTAMRNRFPHTCVRRTLENPAVADIHRASSLLRNWDRQKRSARPI